MREHRRWEKVREHVRWNMREQKMGEGEGACEIEHEGTQ